MISLAVLIACYILVLISGKLIQRMNFLGYLFIAVFTVIQVLFMIYYLFNMEVPEP